MERDEWQALIVCWIFSSIIGYLTTNALYGIVLACLIITFPVLLIIRYFKYSRKFGVLPLPPFACYIYDENGLLGGFKGKDWQLVENPTDLITEKKLRVKKYDKERGEFDDKNSILELDFEEEYNKLLNEFLKQFIPDPDPNDDLNNTQSLGYLIRKSGRMELLEQYNRLSMEQKINIAEVMRTLLALHFNLIGTPKVYQIASLTNGIYIYWFALALPHEYSTYRTKLFFRKWNIIPWRSGFPVVEMWGKEVAHFVQRIGNKELKVVLALPIQDEQYRKEKFFNIKKYSIFVDALGAYTKKILEAIPQLSAIELMKFEKEIAEEKAEIYRRGLDRAIASVTELSSLTMSALSLVSKASGIISKMPEVPESVKRELSTIIPEIEEKESRLKKLIEKTKGLILGETKPTEVKPPSGASVPTPSVEEEEKKSEA
ncbi:MAG: hypothetical protein ACKD6O_08055 [Candidatus Bathyarchaeota archaeon]